MKLSATKLRSELYQVLDRVLETGEPVEVVRGKGTVVLRPKASPRPGRRKRSGKPNPDVVVGNPDDLVHFDWAAHWKPFL